MNVDGWAPIRRALRKETRPPRHCSNSRRRPQPHRHPEYSVRRPPFSSSSLRAPRHRARHHRRERRRPQRRQRRPRQSSAARNVVTGSVRAGLRVVRLRNSRILCGRFRRSRHHHLLLHRHSHSGRCNHRHRLHRRRRRSSGKCSHRHHLRRSSCNSSNGKCSHHHRHHNGRCSRHQRRAHQGLRRVRVRLVRHHKDRPRRRRRRNRHRSPVRSLPRRRNSAARSAQNGTGGLIGRPLHEMGSSARGQWFNTFLNCHGSRLSMSSGKRPGRPVSGVQSV